MWQRGHFALRRAMRLSQQTRCFCDAPRFLGTCKWFNNVKGWGFITRDDNGLDVFTHWSFLKMEGDAFRKLIPGQNVEFGLETDERGKLKAVDVTAPGGEPLQDFGIDTRGQNELKDDW